jgi:predicted DNA-binding protein YlxM (UPF0122 family)
MSLTLSQIQNIIQLYINEGYSTHKLAEQFKVGHKKISQILKDNNIEIKKRGGQIKIGNSSELEKSKINKYISEDKELTAKCKQTNIIINDPNNLSGKLTRHLIDLYGDVNIPTNTYQRKKYEQINGKKWFEEYFDIIEIDKDTERKCGLCEWKTTDINNKSGCFTNHIQDVHNISLDDYLIQFPNDVQYHQNYIKKTERDKELLLQENFVICQLCNKKMKSITNSHLLNKHNITVEEYKLKFPNSKIVSESTSNVLSELIKETNINFQPTWTSKGETEIKEFIEGLGFEIYKGKNRKLLEGKEIDLIIPKLKMAIEYNGLYFHTEEMGKNSTYHLNKTLACNQLGYKLIHIFEDEWMTNRELVKSKLKHILGVSDGIKFGARKTIIKKINKEDKSYFLDEFHIQGNDKSDIFYGAYYDNILVGVMTFNSQRNMTKNNDGEYELSRFSTRQGYVISGLGSKMMKQFITDYSPKSIISFADRRWTTDGNNNMYISLGFELVSILKPTYFYYSSKINRYKRYHKFSFGKNNLKKKYTNLDFNKSESDLTKELGYSKIWDCGLFKYKIDFFV